MAAISCRFSCLLLASTIAAQRPQPALQVGDVGAAVDQAIAAVAADFWGAVLVAKDGKPVFARGFGMVDRGAVAKGKEVTALSLFDLGGAVQELSQALAIRMCAERRLRLDDPLGKLLKGWPDDKGAVTVDQLLLHTSGMPTETRWDNGAGETARATLAAMAATSLASRPGERFTYSDLNATVLALVLDARGGGGYDKLLEQKILSPFGMATVAPTDSRSVDARLITWRVAPGAAKGEPASAQNCNWSNRGVRAMLASVHDVHAFLAHLCDGKTFLPAERELLLRPIANGSLRRDRAEVAGRSWARISGYVNGYCTQWTLDAADRDWVIVMTSSDAAATKVTAAAVAVLGPARAALALPSAAPDTAAVPAVKSDPAALSTLPRFVGEFELPNGGRFVVEARDAGLRLHGIGAEAVVRMQTGALDAAGRAAMERHEDLAIAVLARLLAGDVTALDEVFDARGEAVAAATSAVLTAFLADLGPFVRCEFIGDEAAEGRVRTWLRLVGERGRRDLVVTWRDERRFERCEVATAPPPFWLDLAVVAGDRAAGRTARGVPIVCTVEGVGDHRVLVYEDATPGPAGLLDCRLAPRQGR